jgi:predicted O-methyltransferase YrrM
MPAPAYAIGLAFLALFSAVMAILLLALVLLHKLRNVHLLLYRMLHRAAGEHDGQFRQLEALHGLYVELNLKRSLPPTRGWAGSPDFLLELARHAQAARPQIVVECSSGVSTVVLARRLQLNGAGKLYSLEHDSAYARKTRALLLRHGLQDWAQVLDAPLIHHPLDGEDWPWYDLALLPPGAAIDMLVIDGPPRATRTLARYPAGPLLFPRLAPGGAVFLDDALRPDEQAALARWQSEFPGLQQSALACEKGCAVLTAPPPPA